MWFFVLLRMLVLVYLGLLILALLISNRLIFPSVRSSYTDDDKLIKIKSAPGETISARYYYNPDARWTLLYSHGNAEDLGTIDPLMREFHRRGYSIFAYDYRGYGTSSGQASETNTYKDILSAYTWLTKEKGVPPSQIAIMGYSLGGGPSIWLASNRAAGALILQSTFVSAFRVKTRIPLFPFDKYPNLRRIKQVSTPTLFIHGKRDQTIPFWHSQTLASVAAGPARTFWVSEAGHGSVINVAGEAYWEALDTFLNEVAAAE